MGDVQEILGLGSPSPAKPKQSPGPPPSVNEKKRKRPSTFFLLFIYFPTIWDSWSSLNNYLTLSVLGLFFFAWGFYPSVDLFLIHHLTHLAGLSREVLQLREGQQHLVPLMPTVVSSVHSKGGFKEKRKLGARRVDKWFVVQSKFFPQYTLYFHGSYFQIWRSFSVSRFFFFFFFGGGFLGGGGGGYFSKFCFFFWGWFFFFFFFLRPWFSLCSGSWIDWDGLHGTNRIWWWINTGFNWHWRFECACRVHREFKSSAREDGAVFSHWIKEKDKSTGQ